MNDGWHWIHLTGNKTNLSAPNVRPRVVALQLRFGYMRAMGMVLVGVVAWSLLGGHLWQLPQAEVRGRAWVWVWSGDRGPSLSRCVCLGPDEGAG